MFNVELILTTIAQKNISSSLSETFKSIMEKLNEFHWTGIVKKKKCNGVKNYLPLSIGA